MAKKLKKMKYQGDQGSLYDFSMEQQRLRDLANKMLELNIKPLEATPQSGVPGGPDLSTPQRYDVESIGGHPQTAPVIDVNEPQDNPNAPINRSELLDESANPITISGDFSRRGESPSSPIEYGKPLNLQFDQPNIQLDKEQLTDLAVSEISRDRGDFRSAAPTILSLLGAALGSSPMVAGGLGGIDQLSKERAASAASKEKELDRLSKRSIAMLNATGKSGALKTFIDKKTGESVTMLATDFLALPKERQNQLTMKSSEFEKELLKEGGKHKANVTQWQAGKSPTKEQSAEMVRAVKELNNPNSRLGEHFKRSDSYDKLISGIPRSKSGKLNLARMGGPEQIALLYNTIRFLDDNAVREGELKLMLESLSVPERVRLAFSKIADIKDKKSRLKAWDDLERTYVLPPGVAANMLQSVWRISKNSARKSQEYLKPMRARFKRLGMVDSEGKADLSGVLSAVPGEPVLPEMITKRGADFESLDNQGLLDWARNNPKDKGAVREILLKRARR